MSFGPTEIIVVLLIVLVLFGAKKLPELARSMGQSTKEFKQAIRPEDRDDRAASNGHRDEPDHRPEVTTPPDRRV